MSSYGYQNKYKTIAWNSVGRLESDYQGEVDKHDEYVAKAVPKVTYTTGGEEYYPQVACSWHEDEYNIEFKNSIINLIINDHWKEPKLDEEGRYEYAELEGEQTIKLVQINKENNTIRRYKVELEVEEEVTDYLEKLKYGLKVTEEEAVKYWLERSKKYGSVCIAGYYNDLKQFIPVNTFGFGPAYTDEQVRQEAYERFPDCRYVVIVRKESSWENINKELIQKGYMKGIINDVKLNGESILDLKTEVNVETNEDIPYDELPF